MKYFFLVVASCIFASSYSQQDTARTIRSDYIKSYPDYFFLWPVLKQRKFDFEIRNLKGSRNKLQYKSNKPYSFGIGMYLFELGFELAFAIPLDEKSKEIYGESKARDIQLHVLGKRWGMDAFVQKYSGFYLIDPEVDIPANTPYYQRPDIVTRNIGISLNYTFNKNKFSFRSAYNFTERQLTSAGSFIVFGSIDNLYLKADSAIVGNQYLPTFGESSRFSQIKTTVLSIVPGYTYSLIYKGFFLNGTLAIGPATNYVRYKLETGQEDSNFNVSASIAARLSLGYNGDRLFGGLIFTNLGRSTKFENLELSGSNSSFKILMGYRFTETGFLKKRIWDIPQALFH
jgi:hypothetical protein